MLSKYHLGVAIVVAPVATAAARICCLQSTQPQSSLLLPSLSFSPQLLLPPFACEAQRLRRCPICRLQPTQPSLPWPHQRRRCTLASPRSYCLFRRHDPTVANFLNFFIFFRRPHLSPLLSVAQSCPILLLHPPAATTPPQEMTLPASPSNAAPTLADAGRGTSPTAALIIVPSSLASSAASNTAPPLLHYSRAINAALVSSSPLTTIIVATIARRPLFRAAILPLLANPALSSLVPALSDVVSAFSSLRILLPCTIAISVPTRRCHPIL
ncbi:hypothetical protein B296_00015397 [Ensete ventricosum]|uniref:Uncharacterized protein n=1 Tax=Ensete ventricosum TaxID=4639 RepID=A0A427B6S8_ENSVE|nr:hypothetical protein B296_00015397 [Ensete ventricosum]